MVNQDYYGMSELRESMENGGQEVPSPSPDLEKQRKIPCWQVVLLSIVSVVCMSVLVGIGLHVFLGKMESYDEHGQILEKELQQNLKMLKEDVGNLQEKLQKEMDVLAILINSAKIEDGVVILKRGQFGNPQDYFSRNFSEYETGFGNVYKEYWIGLTKLHLLTSLTDWRLRVDAGDGNKIYTAGYQIFRVGPGPRYTLNVANYTKLPNTLELGESFIGHHGMAFSAQDRDMDKSNGSCAKTWKGGWWYNHCYDCNPTGLNIPGEKNYEGIVWRNSKISGFELKSTLSSIKFTLYQA